MALAILFIPIEQDARGGVEGELIALFYRAPTILIRFCVEDDCRLGSGGKVVKEDEVGWFVELLRKDAVLNKGKFNFLYGKSCFF